MQDQGEHIKDSQTSGMDTPDHFVDLSKYETTSDIGEEIKKLQQDIEIRRRVRRRMGMNDDDENILIIDEKIQLLDTEKKKWEAEQEAFGRKAIIVVLLVFLVIPLIIFNPTVGIGLVAIIILIRATFRLIREARRKKKHVISMGEPEAKTVQPSDK